MPQWLVIAPNYADLSALRTVLAELGVTATATTQLLVGAQRATVPLDELAEDPDEDLLVFGGLASNVWTIAGAKDEASIRLHLTMFAKVLKTHTPARDSVPRLEQSAAGWQGCPR